MSSLVPQQALRAQWPIVLSQLAHLGRAGIPAAWWRGVAVVLFLTVLTVLFTWPLATGLGSSTVWHIDPPFSVWRLGWVAHQLFTDPRHLFDGNIFHPEPRTLAYSDAMLLQGLIAAPLIWAGVSPLLAMNLLLFGGIISSGYGMYLLARRLTGDTPAAVLAAIIYAFAPYRADHIMHLELQWAPWIPLTLWAFHRTLSNGRLRDGVLTGIFLICQLLCSIYYALFLAGALAIVAGISLILYRSRITARMLAGLTIGALLLVAVALPYSRPYRQNRVELGERSPYEITRYSATPASYLSVTPEHVLYGPWSGEWSEQEARLFPGATALILFALAFVPPITSVRWVYLAVLAFAVEASFGLNGRLYPLMHEWLTPFKGLRAPGRFGILVLMSVGVLAAYGAATLRRATPERWRRPLTVALAGLMMIEYQFAPPYIEKLPVTPPPVYTWLAREPPGTVTLELPVPDPGAMPLHEHLYIYFATMHWQPLVNGYSGHYPPSYVRFIEKLKKFPDAESMAAIRARGVQMIIVHAELYDTPADYMRTILALEADPGVRLMGSWKDHRGEARSYRVQR